jgi:hypothetical protein
MLGAEGVAEEKLFEDLGLACSTPEGVAGEKLSEDLALRVLEP